MRHLRLLCLTLIVALAAPVHGQFVPAKLAKELAAKRSALAKDDVEGRATVAKWCAGNKLRQTERQLYREILRIEPEHAGAHKALGHVQNDDEWYDNQVEMMQALGKTRRLTEWVEATAEEKATWTQHHGYWLIDDELEKLEAGEALQAHTLDGWTDVLTREYLIVSALKKKSKSVDLARLVEQAIRQWRTDAGLEPADGSRGPLKLKILKDYKAFQQMIKDDIEYYDQSLLKANGWYGGDYCYLSYFHDWYRTIRVLLHEARHQFDAEIWRKMGNMPGWYMEGIAEYYSMHKWDGKKLTMGELNPRVNYSLHFAGKLLKKGKIKGAEQHIRNPWMTAIEPAYYQNAWAFFYFLRNSDYTEGYAKWEKELLDGKMRGTKAQLAGFKKHISEDMKEFDQAYFKQLKKWVKKSPKRMR